MKLHKLISRTVLATALLGATFGGAFVGINNVNAGTNSNTTQAHSVKGNDGDPTKTDMSTITKSQSNDIDTRTSEVGANIRDGFLTLDSVPNLGFGGNQSSSQNSTLDLNNGNNGTIKVTDNRNTDKISGSSNSPSGWTLSAKIDAFKNNNTPITNTDTWKLQLKNSNISNDSTSSNEGGVAPNMQNDSLTATNNNGSQGTIINTNDNHSGYGTNTINYTNSSDASLDIPNVKKGSYTTTMHWNLNTNLTNYNTDYNSNDYE